MATKTTGGSLYSGLLQTNQELAKARELEANALSIGLEQGVKPLQQTLLAQAQEEQKRLARNKAITIVVFLTIGVAVFGYYYITYLMSLT